MSPKSPKPVESKDTLFRKVFEEGPIGMALVGLDFRYMEVNSVFCQITGYSEAELTSKTFIDITHPHDIHLDTHLAGQLARGEIPHFHIDKRYIRKDGEIVWISLNVSILRDAKAHPLRYLSMIQDISEAKRLEAESRVMEQRLRESVARNSQILNTISDLVFVKDRESRLVWANRAFCDFYGMDVDSLVGIVDSPVNPSEYTRKYLEADSRVMETGAPCIVDAEPVTRHDGEVHLFQTVKSPLWNVDGRIDGLVGVARDVTDHKAMQDELRANESRFRALIENAGDMILLLDGDGVGRFLSPSVETVLGYSPAELLGRSAFEFVHEDDRERVLVTFTTAARTPRALAAEEFRFRHKDGAWRILRAVGQNRLDDPAIGGIVLNAHDITERWAAEQKLATSEAYFRALIEQASDVITVLDPDGSVRFASPAIERVLGYTSQELEGRSMLEFTHPDDAAQLAADVAAWPSAPDLAAGSAPARFRYRHKDGSWRFLEGTGRVLLDDPIMKGVIGSVRDVTDRVKSEEERERLIAELQAALNQVKTLSGLLPICASCKRVRDDQGYWTQIEAYVREHSEAEFSHAICPGCAKTLYPEFYAEKSTDEVS